MINKICLMLLTSLLVICSIPLTASAAGHPRSGFGETSVFESTGAYVTYNMNEPYDYTWGVIDNNDATFKRVAIHSNGAHLRVYLPIPTKLDQVYMRGQDNNTAKARYSILVLYTDNTTSLINAPANATSAFQDYFFQIPSSTKLVKQIEIGVLADADGGSNVSELDLSGDPPPDIIPPPVPILSSATKYSKYTDLVWSAVVDNDLQGYNVYVDNAKVTTAPITGTTYRAAGLANNVTHSYQITAIDNAGNESARSEALTSHFDDIAPVKPTGLNAAPSQTSIYLTWVANPANDGVTGYNIYSNGIKVNGAPVITTDYNLTGLTMGLTYQLAITALDSSLNESVRSDSLSVTTVDTTPPGKPNLSATTGDKKIILSWVPNTEPDLNGYKIYNGPLFLQSVPKNQNNYEINDLVNGNLYTLSVLAFDITGNHSEKSTITTSPADTIPPTKPKNFAGAAGNQLTNLFWSANTEPDLKGYNIYKDGVKLTVPMNKNVYRSIGGLVNGTSYQFQISAVDHSGNESELSDAITLTPDINADSTPPVVPSGLTATANKTTINAAWSANTEPDLIGYFIYLNGQRSTYAPITSNTYSFPNLDKGITYSVSVSAVDTSGNESARSAAVDVYITNVPTPANFKAWKTDAGIKLTFTATNPAADKYILHRNGIPIAELPTTNYMDTTADFGSKYTYHLTASIDDLESERATTSIYYSEDAVSFEPGSGSVGGSTGLTDIIKTGISFLNKFGGYIAVILAILFVPTILSFIVWMLKGFPKLEKKKKRGSTAAATKRKPSSASINTDRPRRDDLTVDKRLDKLDKQGRKAEYDDLMNRVRRQTDQQVREAHELGEKGRRTGRDVSAEYGELRKRHNAERNGLAREVREESRGEREARSGRSGRGQRNGR